MPFGFVTKAQLDVHRDELRRDLRASEETQAALVRKITIEWEEWFDRFRRLYARLSKRVTDDEKRAQDAPGEAIAGGGPTTMTPPSAGERRASWLARRGIR